jgi:serine O-acetyltransferase
MLNEVRHRSVEIREARAAAERDSGPVRREGEPSLWQIVKEDYVAHGRDASRAGFQALVVYRFGVARMRVRPLLLRAPLSVLYRALFRGVRNFYGIELPYTAKIGRRVVFEHQHGIVVHGSCVIGDDCIIRHGVTLGIRSLDRLADAPVLGKSVNVGAGAKIIGRVRVGDGAAVGANAVVLEDVPAGRLAVGVPAHLVDTRPSQPVLVKEPRKSR